MILLTPIPIKILVVSSIFLVCFLLRTIAAYQNPLSKTTDAVEGTTTWASCAYTWTSSPPPAHSSGQQALPSRLGGTTALPGLGLGDVDGAPPHFHRHPAATASRSPTIFPGALRLSSSRLLRVVWGGRSVEGLEELAAAMR
ncbi:hypothetical protein DFJ73DRAFT_294916 [Zopfochytrium polystomum]|nr:hypothetical protein DFJ73DRAFT_294916 [Zopfochytrium polystomum]